MAAVFAAAAISMPPVASCRAEGQSARPRVDFNESAERARTLQRDTSPFSSLRSKPFELFNNCEPVAVGMLRFPLFTDAGIEADMARMQRIEARILRMIETRFRYAGLLDEEAGESGRLEIRIAGSPDNFDARGAFEKVVIDLATGDVAFAATWSLSGLGGRGRIYTTPEAWASSMIDRFITDYLAVNAAACAERSAR